FVLLDPDGQAMTSLELAEWLKRQMDRGVKTVAFGLGGPLGLDRMAKGKADLCLSLSRLTLTHEMSRLVLLEQVYRALRLTAGHPYHK
ncbi:MAG: 23S rRNA (pseudouridine(1915)-N(3))-methyltransferase RlmH, partial [Deltaproteobacteria bacterium]|nr:23S rRNA (pseudouridine(1915)-N(3))-methyltransferase RlmH [Deltaproteobacteria bacterium]